MGIALRQSEPKFAIVKKYYDVAKREPTKRGDLEITSTDTFKSNFLDLVRTLVAKQQSHVVIVAHGTSDGLLMPVTDKTTVSANNSAIRDLVELVDEYPSLTAAKVTKFATSYKVTEDEVKDLVKQSDTVRTHDSNCVAVHIRGCKIGATDDNLVNIRKLFNSVVVSAPSCPMLYSSFDPVWSRPADKDVGAWMKANKAATRRREFADTAANRSRLVLDVDYNLSEASTQGVIQHADDLKKWADLFYGNTTHGTQWSMPIAAMWPEKGYVLPHETGYVDQLRASRE